MARGRRPTATADVVVPAPIVEEPPSEETIDEEEDVIDLPLEDKVGDPFFRTLIKKGPFCGRVEDIDQGEKSKERLYRVRYDDGDLEHFTAKEVRMYQDKDAMAVLPTVVDAKRSRRFNQPKGQVAGAESEQTEQPTEAVVEAAPERQNAEKRPAEDAKTPKKGAKKAKVGKIEEATPKTGGNENSSNEEENSGMNIATPTRASAGEGDVSVIKRPAAHPTQEVAPPNETEEETGNDVEVEGNDEDIEEEETATDEVLKKPASVSVDGFIGEPEGTPVLKRPAGAAVLSRSEESDIEMDAGEPDADESVVEEEEEEQEEIVLKRPSAAVLKRPAAAR